jgi:hypothetical protein
MTRSPRSFTIIELLIVIAIIAFFAAVGPHALHFPYTLFLPYGNVFMLGIIIAVVVFIELGWLSLHSPQWPGWSQFLRPLLFNLVCSIAGLSSAVMLPRLLTLAIGPAAVFAATRAIFLIQIAMMIAVSVSLRLVMEMKRDHTDRKWLTRSTLSQLATGLAIILPGVVLNRFSLLYHFEFVSSSAFTSNRSAMLYYVDPGGTTRRMHVDGSGGERVSSDTLKANDILIFGKAPERKIDVYDLDTGSSHSLACSDCQFSSETVAAYRRPVPWDDRPWRNVYRTSGMHGESWRPVMLVPGTERRYYVGVLTRYFQGNDESLFIDELPFQKGKRIYLRAQLPTDEWAWRYVYYLPHDEVLVQLGDTIVLLELKHKRIGYVASGTRPVVTSL